jgi:co-chaperonin GroES (HSP10)
MKMTDSTVAGNAADLEEAFPLVDPGAIPLGARVLVQLRKAKKRMTQSGIILPEETRDTERAQNPVAKVIAFGPLAFKKRDTMEPWPEGSWCEVGDYLRVPKWTGDRWEVALGDGIKRLTPSETRNKPVARKSLVASKAIQAGHVFTAQNLTTKRPGTGISPMRWDEVIGRHAPRDFAEDELIRL